MITIHHLENSRSHRIIWLLEELGADYEIAHYERDPETMLAPTSLRELHPLGKSPVITDGDTTVAESGAIIEYLLDQFDDQSLRPAPGSSAFLAYRYWMHYAEGSAMNPFLLHIVFDQLPKQGPFLAKPLLSSVTKIFNAQYLNAEVARHLDYWESHLADQPYFAGDDFTAADIQMSIPLESAKARGIDGEAYQNILGLHQRLKEREAYQRAVERGGGLELQAD